MVFMAALRQAPWIPRGCSATRAPPTLPASWACIRWGTTERQAARAGLSIRTGIGLLSASASTASLVGLVFGARARPAMPEAATVLPSKDSAILGSASGESLLRYLEAG